MINLKAKEILLKGRHAELDEIKYAKSVGYWTDNKIIEHDEGMTLNIKLMKEISKDFVVDNFLFSLSTRNLVFRSGLSAFVNSFNMPVHSFPLNEDHRQCEICLDAVYSKERRINDLFIEMFAVGGLYSRSIVSLAITLQFSQKLEHMTPKKDDLEILKSIFKLIVSLNDSTSAPQLSKLIAKHKILKSNSEERRLLLETLGFMSILETKEHKGFLNHYTNRKYQDDTRKSSRGDYEYPVDWWKASDGINRKAVKFWFPNYYKELLNI